jgi:hypothetical protein
MTDSELLEKAIRDYPIGTKIKSIYDGYIHICNTKPFIFTCPSYIYVKDENGSLRCIYSKTEKKWAEIINQNIMTQQEFNSLKVGDFISNYEIIHKYKEFLIVKCDDGHDLFDLAKINNLELKVNPDVIDWDKPKLLYCGTRIVATTGSHIGDYFEGVCVSDEFEYSEMWIKSAFKPYKKPFI